ncbi:hypothetical protein [Pseudoduganella armeniaca]|uniref:Uncharacterized protein n=1 Tax=Pseudoduganella armeniaca TaxID=2072590 RepID=A0A2R4C697_9BURK|nr:hypothetical protein [Pseudoduganella armeniaca]AVR95082.1 hypothetical protein C9I28_04625 [Pseudoduganella armeniaca]
MLKRILVPAVVLLVLGAIGYFVGVGQAVACGITAVIIYIYAMARRFNGAQAARRIGADRPRDDGGSAAMAASMTSSASDDGTGRGTDDT